MWKKLRYWLQLWDSVWSVPASFALFVMYGMAGAYFFGDMFGFYDPSFFQAAIFACCIMLLFNGVTWFGVYFNWRAAWRYYTGESKNDYYNLSAWQKIALLLFLYCFYVVILTALVLRLV